MSITFIYNASSTQNFYIITAPSVVHFEIANVLLFMINKLNNKSYPKQYKSLRFKCGQ